MEEGVKKSKIKRSFSTPLQSLPAFEAEDKEVAKQLEMFINSINSENSVVVLPPSLFQIKNTLLPQHLMVESKKR